MHLSGELDLAHTHELRTQIRDILTEHDPARLILDLTELDFIDSTGTAVLLWTHFRLAERGHVLCLAAPKGHVRRILSITGLDKRLTIHPTLPS